MKKVVIFILFLTISLLLYAGEYGSMYITNNSTDQGVPGNVADTWYNVTDFTEMIKSSQWTFNGTTDSLDGSTSCAGKYMVRFSLSFKGTLALWDMALDVGGVKYAIIQRRISTITDIGNASGCCVVDIANSQHVGLCVKADDDPTSFTPVHCQVVVVEMQQATFPYYGEMGISGNSSAQTLSTSWPEITNYSDTNANLAGWTYSSDVLTDATGTSGDYLAILSVSFSGATAADYEFGLSKENADPYGVGVTDTEIVLKRTIASGKEDDLGNGNACGIINLSNTDNLRVKGKTSDSYNVTIPESNLTLIKLDGTNTTPYACMVVNDNSTALTLTQNTWIVESHFAGSILDASYWEFDGTNDQLTPINLSAGYYLLNYFLSVSVELGSNNNFNTYCSIFNNGTQIPDATIVRQLQKKVGAVRDIGAASGTAIIAVDNPDVTLDLRLYQNDLGGPSVTVIYSSVNLFRIATINDGTLPVTLSSFTAQYIEDTPTLCWTTQSETSNAGWNIYRGETSEALSNEEAYLLNLSLGLIPGAGSTSEPTDYSFEDFFPVYQGNTYFYWLESVDYSGATELYGPISLTIPENEWENPNSPEIPKPYGLHQNYPNPFNPSTEISFMMKESCFAELSIYNVKGEKIKTIFTNESIPRDELKIYNWNGKDESSKEVSTGVYYYKLRTTKGNFVRKMILMK